MIKNSLVGLYIPVLDSAITEANIGLITEKDGIIHVELKFGFPVEWCKDNIQAFVKAHLEQTNTTQPINIHVVSRIQRHAVQPGVQGSLQIKNIIGVASGKGGVGKSTIATLLARALQAMGAQVGLVDADIYGPSIPYLLKAEDKKPKIDNNKLYPINVQNIHTISMGHLVSQNSAMIWRGPMATQALTQLINDTAWPELDYLIVDLPPGTGDISLSLAQKIPVAGTVVVTTPEEMALLDVRRAIAMFAKLNITVLGIIENMSHFQCPHCSKSSHIFSANGGSRLSNETGKKLLGQIPIEHDLQSELAKADIKPYISLALKVVQQLSLKGTAMQQVSLGKVVVQ